MSGFRWARQGHLGLAWLILLALVGQFFLAGAGAFGATSFDAHAGLGVLLVPATLLLLILALLGRALWKTTLLLLGLLIVQLLLGGLGRDQEAWVGAFHAVNALAVLAVALELARRARADAADLRSRV